MPLVPFVRMAAGSHQSQCVATGATLPSKVFLMQPPVYCGSALCRDAITSMPHGWMAWTLQTSWMCFHSTQLGWPYWGPLHSWELCFTWWWLASILDCGDQLPISGQHCNSILAAVWHHATKCSRLSWCAILLFPSLSLPRGSTSSSGPSLPIPVLSPPHPHSVWKSSLVWLLGPQGL